jgi:glycosidase
VNAFYLGPLFESGSHGYDTVDYYTIDRRLGDNASFAALCARFRENDMRIVLDGVFNHVGRDFWAFRDVRNRGKDSPCCSWFSGLRFDRHSPMGDPFTYDTWQGHYNLPKLNLKNPAVKEHLFKAVESWIQTFGIDGLRLDAADCVDLDFLRELAAFTKGIKKDFWLMGEIIHGDYRRWANPSTLDSVTNYECYKGLYSSLNEKNYFEIAHSLQRLFGRGGLCEGLALYSFADNHDVDRVASKLKKPAHLYPLYLLLMTMPGAPSVYYGSEWAVKAVKRGGDDAPLRPAIETAAQNEARHHHLFAAIARLAAIRRSSPALKYGNYAQLHASLEQFAFIRQADDSTAIVALNAADKEAQIELTLPFDAKNSLTDILNGNERIEADGRKVSLVLPPCWGRILTTERG